jgi:hypothetical protein
VRSVERFDLGGRKHESAHRRRSYSVGKLAKPSGRFFEKKRRLRGQERPVRERVERALCVVPARVDAVIIGALNACCGDVS